MILSSFITITSVSESDVSHVPISCVKLEEVSTSRISSIVCTAEGVCFLADKGLKRVYRVELRTGNCYTFGKSYLGEGLRLSIMV